MPLLRRASGRIAAVATKPSSSSGIRWRRAARIAPAIPGEFASTQRCRYRERIAKDGAMMIERRLDRRALA
jgi:hypothetical protein